MIRASTGGTLELDLAYNLTRSKPRGTVIGVAVMLLVGVAVLGLTIAKPRSTDRGRFPPARAPLCVVQARRSSCASPTCSRRARKSAVSAARSKSRRSATRPPRGPRPRSSAIASRSRAGAHLTADRAGGADQLRGVVFDSQFKPIVTMKLDGAPTRTRISPTAATATTVFVTDRNPATTRSPSPPRRRDRDGERQDADGSRTVKVVRDGQPFAQRTSTSGGSPSPATATSSTPA